MTIQEVANKFVNLCKEGKYDQAYGMYADNEVSEAMLVGLHIYQVWDKGCK